jgi:hypothetical protein
MSNKQLCITFAGGVYAHTYIRTMHRKHSSHCRVLEYVYNTLPSSGHSIVVTRLNGRVFIGSLSSNGHIRHNFNNL